MVLSQSHLKHPHHHLHHDHFDSNDRSFLSILTDPIVSLFRSIPIEILDQNEELSPSQKDFLADFVEIRIECKEDDPTELLQFDGQLISTVVVDVLSDVLDKVEEMEQDESFKNVEIPQIIVEETTSFPCIDIVVQSFDKLQDIPVELTDSGLFSDIDEDDSSDFGIDEAIPLEIFEPIEEVSATTSCSFIRSQSSARCKIILPDNSFVCTLPPISATFSAPVITPKKVIKRKKSVSTTTKMAAEVLQNEPHCFIASSSSIDRPFKLLVQKETFLIDAESMSRISPIFNVMCFGKDFEKMDLSREIVDEKSNDIDCFLRAVHDTSMINSSNFALVLRLSNKYQVDPVIEACQNFIIRQHLDVLRADEILTMLIAAFEHHCRKEVVQKLIKRLASEGNSVFTKLKISRYLPAQVYGSVISTSMNLNQIKEHEQMNGHCLKQERSKIRWRQSVCDECKSVAECANCDECKKTMCRNHVSNLKCSSDYGTKMAADLKKKIVDFEWQD
ncbi:hypothetical protein L3Y34_018464 [Caenorhabditis briggsae]|uniref:BTB domain-containing protein n=2 Tax=Caenorhabditis briggsae TaxID=6238 RepID=A0AAE9IV84_CAEBR|nr:hypothetical protein L3Y34_018464 [Caenorhabditis briggsae]